MTWPLAPRRFAPLASTQDHPFIFEDQTFAHGLWDFEDRDHDPEEVLLLSLLICACAASLSILDFRVIEKSKSHAV